MTSRITHGSVIRHAYLWAREHARGEESDRKGRPACVMVITRGSDGRETPLIFPITSRSPMPGTDAVKIPEIEARRVALRTPAWVIVDEFNVDDLETSFAVEDREPLGYFSKKFMSVIAATAVASIRSRSSRQVIDRQFDDVHLSGHARYCPSGKQCGPTAGRNRGQPSVLVLERAGSQ